MAAFAYIALDENGRRRKGVMEADSPRQTRQLLREKRWAPVSVLPVSERKKNESHGFARRKAGQVGRLGLRDLSIITRQLATLVQSGLPVEQALQALSRQEEKPHVKTLLAALRAKVVEGQSLADSIGAFPGSFPELFKGSIHAGERTGHLGLVLEYLADYAEHSHQARQKMLLALLYPAILAGVSCLIIVFLMTFIMPDMIRVFTGAGHALPLLTRGLIAITQGLQRYGLVVLLVLALAVWQARRWVSRPDIRLAFDRNLLRWPIIGPLALQYNATRFASTLGMMQESGVSLLQALEISATVLGNRHLRSEVQEIAKKVSEGISLSAAMEKSGVFPPVLVTMAASGEASGRLGAMLIRSSVSQQRDLESRVAILLGLFEPAILLIMGGIVLLLVLAIIMPILNLNQMVK